MDKNEKRAIEWDCQQLLHRVTLLIDDENWQELANCYTEDAQLARPSDPHNPVKGRANILASFLVRKPLKTCHILANSHFTVESETRAVAKSRVWLITGAEDQPMPIKTSNPILVGSFTDHLQKVGDEWFISSRQGSIEFKHSSS